MSSAVVPSRSYSRNCGGAVDSAVRTSCSGILSRPPAGRARAKEELPRFSTVDENADLVEHAMSVIENPLDFGVFQELEPMLHIDTLSLRRAVRQRTGSPRRQSR
jgi:hypothetical protein